MIVWLLACGTEAPPPVAEASFTDPAAPWLGPASDDVPMVDLPDVADAVDEALRAIADLDAAPLIAAYTSAMADAEAGCPAFFTAADGFDYWLDDCETTSGARFSGFGVADVTGGVPLDFGLVGETTTVGGSGELVGADGTVVDVNGFVQATFGEAPGVSMTSLVLSGTFVTDDPVAAGTWLELGWEPEMTVVQYDLGGPGVTLVSGVIEGLGDGTRPVVIQDVVIASVPEFTDCPEEPTGVVSVRLAAGWVDVIFDPVQVGDVIETPEGTCDGCGAAWAGTTYLGDVCPDLGPLR